MLKLKPWLADLLGVLTPHTKTAGVFQSRQQFAINPALAPDHAPDGCMANPGFHAEIAHRRNYVLLHQHIQHVLDISRDLDRASKYGIIRVRFTKSRPLATPSEITGAGNRCASGHAHQSKAVAP